MKRKWTAYSTSIFVLSKLFNKTGLMTLLIAAMLYIVSGIMGSGGVPRASADEGIASRDSDKGIASRDSDKGIASRDSDKGIASRDSDKGIASSPGPQRMK